MCGLFIFILLLIIIVLYINQKYLIENFNAYQTFQTFQTFQPFLSFLPTPTPTPTPTQTFFPINTYKYPLINPANSPYANGYYIPDSNGYTDLPWSNTQLGNTTNMSYDIRGDPLAIPRTNFVWNNGTTFPIYN